MGIRRLSTLALAFGLAAGLSTACFKRSSPLPEMAINLDAGIRNFVSLSDNESDVIRSTKLSYVKEAVPVDTSGNSLSAVQVSHLFYFKDLGTKVYFRSGKVVLIEMQEPFKGMVQGKNLKVFHFELLQDRTWVEVLTREFGSPVARGAGGRFGAEALFYGWGDVSFNRMGPNEIALYTDPAISIYRQRNFGREIRLFK